MKTDEALRIKILQRCKAAVFEALTGRTQAGTWPLTPEEEKQIEKFDSYAQTLTDDLMKIIEEHESTKILIDPKLFEKFQNIPLERDPYAGRYK